MSEQYCSFHSSKKIKSLDRESIQTIFSPSRHPFTPYQKTNADFDDDDDDFIDLLDGDQDESLEFEQILDVSESEVEAQRTEEITSRIASSSIDLQPSIRSSAELSDDEYISADEDTRDSPVVLPVSVDAVNKEILQLLHQTHGLLLSSRRLLKIMRNIGVIDHYVRHFQGGPPNGFVIDIEVS